MALERFGVLNDMMTVLHPASVGIPCTESDLCDIATELSFNMHLTTLNFAGIRIGPEAAIAIGRAVSSPKSCVQYIKFTGCGLTSEAIEGFTKHAKGNRRLEILDVSKNSLRDEGALHVAAFVETTPTLRVLEASECKIGPLGANAIAGCVAAHKRLTTLNLSNNKLRESGATAIATKGLLENTSVSVVDLGGNSINCEGGIAIADMLRRNKTIESLHIGNNYISESIPHIALALSQRGVPSRVVDLSRNRITNTISRTMSSLLEGSKLNIACLTLEGNPLGDDGLVALFHALRGTNVQFLDLSNCMLTSTSGVVLADLIRACPILNSLQIDNNALGDDALGEIAKAYQSSVSMASINLERTNMGSAGCSAMAAAIVRQQKLRSINIAENHNLSVADVRSILDAVSQVHLCERVDLSDLKLPDSEDLLRSMMAAFAANEHLERIVIQHNPMASGFPDGTMTRDFALQLADGASLAQFVQNTSAGGPSGTSSILSLVSGAGANHLSTNSTTGASRSVLHASSGALQTADATTANSSVRAAYRPAWATTRPMEHKSSALTTPGDEVNDAAEDGRCIPLVPQTQSLHHSMYPGYGVGRMSAGNYIQTLSNPVPYTVDNSRGHTLPLVLSADNSAYLKYPVFRPLKRSPYSLMSLEMNTGGLLVTEDQLKRKFQELDVDGHHYLNRAEFKKAYLSYQGFGRPITERELNEWMKQLDQGHGDKLFFDEFAVLMLKLAQR